MSQSSYFKSFESDLVTSLGGGGGFLKLGQHLEWFWIGMKLGRRENKDKS